MKRTILSNVLVALMFLLGAGAAHAQTVIFDQVDTSRAIGIDDLSYDGRLWDVTFTAGVPASLPYGTFPGVYDFPDPIGEPCTPLEVEAGGCGPQAQGAVEAVNAALTAAGAVDVGAEELPQGYNIFRIGFEGYILDAPVVPPVDSVWFWEGTAPDNNNANWGVPAQADTDCYALCERVWADFTEVGGAAPPMISILPQPQEIISAVLEGQNASDREFSVSNSGAGTLDYAITAVTDNGGAWLSVTPGNGTSAGEPDTITVMYAAAIVENLARDVYTATITVSDTNASNDPQTIDVTLIVTDLPGIELSKTMLTPEAVLGNDALPDSFSVTNSGGFLLAYDVWVNNVTWMSVFPLSGSSLPAGQSDTVDVTYDTSGLGVGVYQGTIEVTSPAAVNTPQKIDVSLTISDSAELGLTNVIQTKKVNTIPGIVFDPAGTYKKPAFSFNLPQTSISGNLLFHDGGSLSFSSPQTTTTYTYADWTFEIRSTCAANNDPCLVTTDNGAEAPWALRDVDPSAGTARMVFTDTGAQAFNDLASPTGPVQVFVTSVQYRGNFPGGVGLAGADASCTLAANNAGLSGAWTAWLSDDTTDARDRIPDAEYRLLDGTLVANNLADLTDGTLDAPILVDETGTTISSNSDETYTGTAADGTNSGLGTCLNWTSISNVNTGQIGLASFTDATWTDQNFADDCDIFNRLYCFSGSQFQVEETFADVTFIPEPSAAALASAALAALGFIQLASRRRRG